MKFTLPTAELSNELKKVLSVVSGRSTLPVLSNVLLNAKDNKLTLVTTDLEVRITTSVEATIEREGETTLPAKKFGQIISKLDGEQVTIDTDDNLTTTIKSASSTFKIMGLDSAEFPMDLDFQEERQLSFPVAEIGKTLKKIAYAVSSDQSRYVLNGIYISIKEGNFTAVATDGKRLALVEKILDDSEDIVDGEVILPIKVVNELQRLLEGEGEVLIKFSDSRASFTIGDTIISSKLVEGSYPNYRQVIPTSFENSVILPRETIESVLDRVSLVVSDSGASVKFALSENLLTLNASSELGEANEPIDISFEGEDVNIAFNPDYLRDPLRNLECDEITVRFNDEFKPVVILGDEGFLCVIMPMRN